MNELPPNLRKLALIPDTSEMPLRGILPITPSISREEFEEKFGKNELKWSDEANDWVEPARLHGDIQRQMQDDFAALRLSGTGGRRDEEGKSKERVRQYAFLTEEEEEVFAEEEEKKRQEKREAKAAAERERRRQELERAKRKNRRPS